MIFWKLAVSNKPLRTLTLYHDSGHAFGMFLFIIDDQGAILRDTIMMLYDQETLSFHEVYFCLADAAIPSQDPVVKTDAYRQALHATEHDMHPFGEFPLRGQLLRQYVYADHLGDTQAMIDDLIKATGRTD